MQGTCLNHCLALPNKIFEYIQAGIPILLTDLPEMQRVVFDYGVGEVFPDGDDQIIAEKLDKLLSDDEQIKHKYQTAARVAAGKLNWDVEKKRLLGIYMSLLNKDENETN